MFLCICSKIVVGEKYTLLQLIYTVAHFPLGYVQQPLVNK